MSEREECCEKHERGRRCGDCPHDDRLVDHLGGNPALREELLGRLTSLRARVVRRAVEAEREAIAATLADEAAFFRREAEEASKTRRFYCEGYARLLERHAAAIRRRGE